ncbi:MAG: class I SAM-dependent methyltransferase [Alistipes sp.]|nr:class I SAM-dependent methyltransferase [Alistipes sp.]
MSKGIATAERVSLSASDNFVYQRSLLAYHKAAEIVSGDVLEIGTGTGYGVSIIAPKAMRFITIDKKLPAAHDCGDGNVEYYEATVPPIPADNNSFDYVVCFQVIEHIKKDLEFVREVHRVLKPRGKFIVTTPNVLMSLTRNPYHVREYLADELKNILECEFSQVEALGVSGNERVMKYYNKNRRSVKLITSVDFFDLQHRLPRQMLQLPYDVLNRFNRWRLLRKNRKLTTSITMDDYSIGPVSDECFDLFFVATK